ncbi:hypothetical protein C1646_758340 [Rhizophagus diaphanus]|nr:hypothetical protein C1646_758340 [Rhizophagus diaphanus] [Rhizophagus sp. MUCL 43196]
MSYMQKEERNNKRRLRGGVNSPEELAKRFPILAQCFPKELLPLLTQKDEYPYELNDPDRFSRTKLPSREEFNTTLGGLNYCEQGFKKCKHEIKGKKSVYHAQKVWNETDCKIFEDYHMLYLKRDMLILADALQNFRAVMIDACGLDPANYITLPSYAFDVAKKVTKVKLELFHEGQEDMHEFVQRWMRGGNSMAPRRIAIEDAFNAEVKGNTFTNAFPVHIDGNSLIGDLKEAIKDKIDTPAGFKAKDLKLWNVKIPDDQDDLLRNLTLNGGDELLATREIVNYWSEKPPKRYIHVLVEPPPSTTSSNREQKLLERIALLEKSLSKSVYAFDIVVSPKRTKSFKGTVDIDDATLDGLKEYIREMEKPPALENDGAVLNFKFTVLIETPSKPFNEWTFPKVCELYGLSDDSNPSIDVYSAFSCGSADLSSEKSKAVVTHLMAELNLRKKTTPWILAYESTKSIYSY